MFLNVLSIDCGMNEKKSSIFYVQGSGEGAPANGPRALTQRTRSARHRLRRRRRAAVRRDRQPAMERPGRALPRLLLSLLLATVARAAHARPEDSFGEVADDDFYFEATGTKSIRCPGPARAAVWRKPADCAYFLWRRALVPAPLPPRKWRVEIVRISVHRRVRRANPARSRRTSCVSDEEYYRMPQLFRLDDYDACLSRPTGAYCVGSFELTDDGRSPLMRLMKVYVVPRSVVPVATSSMRRLLHRLDYDL
ncbi:hypothetical protein EVAR_70902_1 [Eumeta japonica]|uniref:Uncharacterized protein n=1 Tax=Eumeta variegata TaxID=151549 RepID=A0A4C2ADT3_EUMVA|nr:hypothetical protein EVAR_70902_1 [Eumeta japonica]